MVERPFILVTLDSCRLDTYLQARTPFLDSLGTCHAARTHGDFTIPSHAALFAGSLPHSNMLPGKRPMFEGSIPRYLRKKGYKAFGAVSVPFLHRTFGFGEDFDEWRDSDPDADKDLLCLPLLPMLRWLSEKGKDTLPFLFLNVGETHFPYETTERKPWREKLGLMIWPWSEKDLRHDYAGIDQQLLLDMRQAQVDALEWVDALLSEWEAPKDAVWLVTADHGELFGEHHLFGHGHGSYPEEVTVPIICSDWEWLYQFMGGPHGP